jgi:hypothetical protein
MDTLRALSSGLLARRTSAATQFVSNIPELLTASSLPVKNAGTSPVATASP